MDNCLFQKHRRNKRGETNNRQLIVFFYFIFFLRECLAGSDSQAFNWIGKMFAEQVVMAAATLQQDNVLLSTSLLRV